ncbi:MAG: CBS domain-containing protein [Reyranella sp.]|jgi:acetoin utilization protein AcuB|nr:CBS domain-containing protein [bacterium]MBK9776966.1 CBS domain-containing protein [bacterium]MBP6769953.1 CBS domain-containing protein [Reyranella sp.]
MFVADWMTRQVITADPQESVLHAMHVMRDRGIKHLPVVKDGKLVGVISDRDIKAYCPSKATALDVYEINYLLSKASVREAMGARLLTIAPDAPVEDAAMMMLDENVGCLPVVAGETLAGIISDRDIFRALVDISGVRHGGHRICVIIADRPGTVKEVADIIRKHGFHLRGIMTSYEGVAAGSRRAVIRTTNESDFAPLRAELEKTYGSASIS